MGTQTSPDFSIHTPQKSTATTMTALLERKDREIAGSSDSVGMMGISLTPPSIQHEVPGKEKAPEVIKKRGKRPRILLDERFESPRKPKTPKITKEKRSIPSKSTEKKTIPLVKPLEKPAIHITYSRRKNKLQKTSSAIRPPIEVEVATKVSAAKRVLDFDNEGSNSESHQKRPSRNTFIQVAKSSSSSVSLTKKETCRSLMRLRCRCCICGLEKIRRVGLVIPRRIRTLARLSKARKRKILPEGSMNDGFFCVKFLTRAFLPFTNKRTWGIRIRRLNCEPLNKLMKDKQSGSPNKAKGLKDAEIGKTTKPTKKKPTKKTKAKDPFDNLTLEERFDFIFQQFEKLSVNSSALVLYEKKKSKMIKVEFTLDPETMRVSNILREREDGSDPVNEADEERKKWWDEQRKVLWGKVSVFVYIMRHFLGDRRFIPWDGSVTDSAVGVYLTQNVSDVLSSNAYMSVAARFPLKVPSEEGEVCEQGEVIGRTMSDLQCDNKECLDELDVASSQGSTEGNFVVQDVLDKAGERDCFIGSSSSPQQQKNCPNDTNKDHASHQSPQTKAKKKGKVVEEVIDWDTLRKTYSTKKDGNDSCQGTKNSVDWDAVRKADVKEIADTIAQRGQMNILAIKIKDFLNRIYKDHGSVDLEWLRDVPPSKAKEFLLDIHGLGLKSVECLRLLTLHHHAFPVDVNVGRIAIRLGWVPLQPLVDDLEMHLIDSYPLMDKIQAYLRPRLCHLTTEQLYELHYLVITFGKVFCTKKAPNCNACPLRGNCKHYASASASARLALRNKQEKSGKRTPKKATRNPVNVIPSQLGIAPMDDLFIPQSLSQNCEPIIEEPPSPEPKREAPLEVDIEDLCSKDSCDEMPFFNLCAQRLIDHMSDDEEKEMSNSIVSLSQQDSSIPARKQKEISRLRTEHQVYELPDNHPLLKGLEKRQENDPCPYLLAIWSHDENKHNCQCHEKTECDCQEQDHLTVPGTLLIPCKSAMRGRFPLNGTYFQVNEVFADEETSKHPINVPRKWIWELNKRTLYCGSSTSSIARDIPVERIMDLFWRGFICVRGFNRKTRYPRPIPSRFHLRPTNASKKKKGENE